MTDSPLAGRSVLVTGGTGTFGHAFTAHALASGVHRLVLVSRDELKQAQMREAFPDDRLRFFVGDVRDAPRLALALRGVQDVIHAAAMKRIEACEAEPLEAIATNVRGTAHVALAAIDAGVERAVFLSTDKAPAACTLYGATKFCAERLWVQSNVYAAGTGTRLSATRYGNVLGSRGSVLDLWRKQYAAQQPLTITDEAATRFWMPPSVAVDLVCLALDSMHGGETFIPKIKAAPILDVARALVERAGTYSPGHVVTGLRPGERVHETLISADEARRTFDAGDCYVIAPQQMTWRGPVLTSVPPVPAGFEYRSDTADRLTIDELREMI